MEGCLHKSPSRYLLLCVALVSVSFFEIFKNRLENTRPVVKGLDIPKPAKSFICGATAGAVASFLVNPFDVAKTYQQTRAGKAVPSFTILKDVYRQDGIGGWFKGVGPRVVKSACACAMMITFYEYGKDLINKIKRQ